MITFITRLSVCRDRGEMILKQIGIIMVASVCNADAFCAFSFTGTLLRQLHYSSRDDWRNVMMVWRVFGHRLRKRLPRMSLER